MIESMEEFKGYIDLLGLLRDIWHDLTFLSTHKLRIYKDRCGMNRIREMWIHNADDKVMEIRNIIEKTMKDIEKDIENSFKFPKQPT